LDGIPEGSRASKSWGFLRPEQVAPALNKVKHLNEIAIERGQSLAQMALVWLLKDPRVTSVLIGASSVKQLENNVAALKKRHFTAIELQQIEMILTGEKYQPPRSQSPSVYAVKDPDNSTPSRGDFIKNLAKRVGSSRE
ncbi:MAG TPA: aldo/keto reductase, partial [Prolixibacteraceae bacterium]|nr:aldo/keto reductase [Prolixibacteraceae bacterium]